MSILQEYGRIRKSIGEQEYLNIEKFLETHPDILLSDVYYKPSCWEHYLKWSIKAESDPKKKKVRQAKYVSWLKEQRKESDFWNG